MPMSMESGDSKGITSGSSSNSLPSWISSCIEQGLPVSLEESGNPLILLADNRTEDNNINKAALRWDFIMSDLKRQQSQFTTFRDLKILVGSWNINGQAVMEDLSPWMDVIRKKPDIVFVGLQEMDRSAEAFVASSSSREQVWNSILLQSLQQHSEGLNYKFVISKSLVGIYAAMFIRTELADRLSGPPQTCSAACGLMGMMGNKGAVGIRVRIDTDFICFVNSHLAPHVENVARRNQDYTDLSKRLLFTIPPPKTVNGTTSDEILSEWNDVPSGTTKATIWDCGVLLWAGDLNYRIDLPTEEVRNSVMAGEYHIIKEGDQLKAQIEKGMAFSPFTEYPITFPPTYKFIVGTEDYDSRPEAKPPAWTDRILFRKGDSVEMHAYEATMQINSSDHKPVSLYLTGKMRFVDRSLFEECLSSTLRQLDIYENEAIPITHLSTHSLNFGEIPYKRTLMLPFSILNTGQVLARYSFISKNQSVTGGTISAPWIHVQPRHGIILPGDSAEIRVYVAVEGSYACQMNNGSLTPEDILIAHIDGGKDHFISIEGTFRKTLFCTHLDWWMEKHIIASLPDTDTGHLTPYEGIPKPLSLLIETIISHGLHIDNLFLESGRLEMLCEIQDCIDFGKPFSKEIYESDVGIFSIAESILRFLDSLVQPVIPYGLHKSCLDASHDQEISRVFVENLPTSHRNTFYYIMHFLRKILLTSNKTLSPEDMALVFGKVMIKPNPESIKQETKGSDTLRTKFLCTFIKEPL